MKYRAFFSYSRADDRLANWLHRQLDSYRTPRELVGTKDGDLTVPRKLHPIFRDRTDLEAGGNLDGALQAALEDSEALIVLCSPTSAKSRWVDLECQRFLNLGRDARVFPVIAGGEPDSGNPETECFPPALQGKGLLAADLREMKMPDGRLVGDGRDGGRLKLIAGLLGVPLDKLARRERQRQKARMMAASAAAVLFAGLAMVAGAQTVEQMRQRSIATEQRSIAVRERSVAENERERAENSVARFVTERGWSSLQENNVSTAVRYALLAGLQFPQRSDLATEVLARVRREFASPISVLPADGRLLTTTWNDNGPRIVRLASNRKIEGWQLNPAELLFSHALSDGEDVCGSGDSVAVICGQRGLARSISLLDGAALAQFKENHLHAASPALSMNGRRLASLSNGRAKVWDVQTGALLETQLFPAQDGAKLALAISATGKTVLALNETGSVLIWQVGAPEQAQRFPEMLSEGATCRMTTPTPWTTQLDVSCESSEGYESIMIGLSSSGFDVSNDPVLYGWRGAGPGNMMGLPEPMLAGPSFVKRSPGEAWLYTDYVTRGETRDDFVTLMGDGRTVRLDPNGRVTVAAEGRGHREIATGVSAAIMSPDRRAILLASENGSARLFDLEQIIASPLATGKFSAYERSSPRGPAFSPDGRFVLAMRNIDSEVLVIDTQSGGTFELQTFDEGDEMFAGVRAGNAVDRVLFEGGRIYASTFQKKIIHVWDLSSPSIRDEIKTEGNENLMDRLREQGLQLLSDQVVQAQSPDDKFTLERIDGGGLSLRSRQSGFALAVFEPSGNSPLRTAAFSANSQLLATLSMAGVLEVWDLSTFGKSFKESADWACTNVLAQSELYTFSDLEIAGDPLLRERGVNNELDLCAE